MLHAAAWTFFALFGAVFIFFALINAVCQVLQFFRSPAPSLVPLIGGFLGAIAFRFSPVHGLRPYWWVPLLVDLSIPRVLLSLPWVIRTQLRYSSRNLLREYRCRLDQRESLHLRLYRNRACLVIVVKDRTRDKPLRITRSGSGTWDLLEGVLSVGIGAAKLLFRELSEGTLELQNIDASDDSGMLLILPKGKPLRLKVHKPSHAQ